MQMTQEEIIHHYNQAKNKKADIGVLADLNGTDKESIRAILIDAGLMEPDGKAKKTVKTEPAADKNRKEIGEEICRRIGAGEKNEDIALAVGCTVATVKNHRKKLEEAGRTDRQTDAERPAKPERIEKTTGIPLSARVGAIIRAVPGRAPDSVKLQAFELCRALLESEPV